MPTHSLEGAVDRLRQKVGCDWPAISKAREDSRSKKQELQSWLGNLDSFDTSIVTFGSLAREEWTSQSDLDWTLLIDGAADPQHLNTAQQIARLLEGKGLKKPGPTGLFGSMSFSHDIIHQIGGEDDTNRNITQRVLLLLESWAVGKTEAYDRVVRNVLNRYLDDDWGFKYGSGQHRVPRFLLNDIVRYWRTVTVDFVYKQRERSGKGWALRGAKLGMSRKLIFVSGLLACFSCDRLELRDALSQGEASIGPAVAHLQAYLRSRPLDIVADALLTRSVSEETAQALFGAYDSFLTLLDNEDKRNHLEALPVEALGSDSIFAEVRLIRRQFQNGLRQLFFGEVQGLRNLTEQYGVF